MEFNQTVMARRSLRAYEEGKTVEKAQIEELIRFAQMAPSWKNSQTGRYYVVMSPEMLEAELFGYIDGRKGKMELADGGTLFIDEIGDMPLNVQAKLLNVLQNGEMERKSEAKRS